MIPIAKPSLGQPEIKAASKTIESGWVAQGPEVIAFEKQFAERVGAKYACAASNCTTALQLALLGVGVKPGDIVLTVSHSFIATANCVRACSAEPYFIDIDLDTLNMSPAKLEEFLDTRCTRRENGVFMNEAASLAMGESPLVYIKEELLGRVSAIMTVHQLGMPSDLGEITRICEKYNIPLVEDAACAIGSEYTMDGGETWLAAGNPAGKATCFSFHPRKVLTTGEGGMITTNDEKIYNYINMIRQHGMDASPFERHSAGKIVFERYVHTGFNFRMSDINAAVGIKQLERIDEIVRIRREINDFYRTELGDLEWLDLPAEPAYASSNWQSYFIRVNEKTERTAMELMEYLLDEGISTRPGVMNAHSEVPYEYKYDLPNSEKARESCVLIPCYNTISKKELETVVGKIRKFSA